MQMERGFMGSLTSLWFFRGAFPRSWGCSRGYEDEEGAVSPALPSGQRSALLGCVVRAAAGGKHGAAAALGSESFVLWTFRG